MRTILPVALPMAAAVAILALGATFFLEIAFGARGIGRLTSAQGINIERSGTVVRAAAGIEIHAGDRLLAPGPGAGLALLDLGMHDHGLQLELDPASRLVVRGENHFGVDGGKVRVTGAGPLRIDLDEGEANLVDDDTEPFDVEISLASGIQISGANSTRVRMLSGSLQGNIGDRLISLEGPGNYLVGGGRIRLEPSPEGPSDSPDNGQDSSPPAGGGGQPNDRESVDDDPGDDGGDDPPGDTEMLGDGPASFIGFVIDGTSGLPIAGAHVALAKLGDDRDQLGQGPSFDRGKGYTWWAVTDGRGIAYIESIPPDTYAVIVSVPSDQSYSDQAFDWVLLLPCTQTSLTLPIEGHVDRLPCRLVDRDGYGVAGVTMTLDGREDDPIRTGRDGCFLLGYLRAGEHQLVAESLSRGESFDSKAESSDSIAVSRWHLEYRAGEMGPFQEPGARSRGGHSDGNMPFDPDGNPRAVIPLIGSGGSVNWWIELDPPEDWLLHALGGTGSAGTGLRPGKGGDNAADPGEGG